MGKNSLTLERLREVLNYDHITGVFTWRVRAGNWPAGSVAGCHHGRYRMIGIDGWQYHAHRLAWWHYYGSKPIHQLDHINGDRGNNAISNLRDVTAKMNMQNLRKPLSNNKLGILGVCQYQGKFRTSIRAHGRLIHLGDFDTAEEASAVYLKAKRELHEGCTI